MRRIIISIATFFVAFLIFITPVISEIQPGTGFFTAAEIKPGSYSFYMEGGRSHFFKVWLNVNQILYLVVRVPLNTDFDVYLLSSEREVLERSLSPAGYAERISYQASSSDYYYIIVVPYFGSKGTYEMQIAIYDPPAKTITTTITETVPVYVTIPKPTVIITTVTKTAYEVKTIREVEYMERFPWILIGLIVLAVAIILSSGLISQSIRAGIEKSKLCIIALSSSSSRQIC
jgi:hypothetical protein